MTPPLSGNIVRRFTGVLIVTIALPIIVLTLPFLASLGHPTTHDDAIYDDAIVGLTTVAQPRPERGETVMLNASILNRVTIVEPWYSSDFIRNGVLISEEFVRPGAVGEEDDSELSSLPNDGDECATILQLYADEINNIMQQRGWYLVHIEIVDDDSVTLRRCSIPKADARR